MIYLILIGGGAIILIAGITVFYYKVKAAGKKEERYETMEKELESSRATKKRRIARDNDSITDVDARLRKNSRDR